MVQIINYKSPVVTKWKKCRQEQLGLKNKRVHCHQRQKAQSVIKRRCSFVLDDDQQSWDKHLLKNAKIFTYFEIPWKCPCILNILPENLEILKYIDSKKAEIFTKTFNNFKKIF